MFGKTFSVRDGDVRRALSSHHRAIDGRAFLDRLFHQRTMLKRDRLTRSWLDAHAAVGATDNSRVLVPIETAGSELSKKESLTIDRRARDAIRLWQSEAVERLQSPRFVDTVDLACFRALDRADNRTIFAFQTMRTQRGHAVRPVADLQTATVAFHTEMIAEGIETHLSETVR